MTCQDIYNIAVNFRSAILQAKYDREFDVKDRMHRFPRGCCDDSCDIFAYYLATEYHFHTLQGKGTYYDDNPYNTTNHAWLITDNKIIIDLTADQFPYFHMCDKGIYVGKENSFYQNLERKQIYDNYDIVNATRLWSDYQIIKNIIDSNL